MCLWLHSKWLDKRQEWQNNMSQCLPLKTMHMHWNCFTSLQRLCGWLLSWGSWMQKRAQNQHWTLANHWCCVQQVAGGHLVKAKGKTQLTCLEELFNFKNLICGYRKQWELQILAWHWFVWRTHGCKVILVWCLKGWLIIGLIVWNTVRIRGTVGWETRPFL